MAEPTPLLKPIAPAQIEPRLWTHGQFVIDHWRPVADDVPLADGLRPLLSLARWRRERQARTPAAGPVGLVLQPGETLGAAADDVSALRVIALRFPKFTDGRAYSTARLLRERWRFEGEVRATGDVLLDQLPLMLRAGFDAFEIVDKATIAALERGLLPAVSRVYQRGVDVVPRLWRARRAAFPRLATAE